MSQVSSGTVTMIEMVFPDQTNHCGTLFGGHALRLMDKAAFVAASRYSCRTAVTACSERVDFKNAVHHGNLIELAATRFVAFNGSQPDTGAGRDLFSLGIRSLGMLAALPEKDLIARMGQERKRLRQLACGAFLHLFLPIEPAFMLEEHMELDSPVEMLDSLLFVVGVMLEYLILRATARVLALASVTITLTLENAVSDTNNRQLWIKLLHLDLEAHPPQSASAIVSITLTVEPGSTSKVQLGLFSPQLPEPKRLDVTLARIRAIVGENSVGRAVLTAKGLRRQSGEALVASRTQYGLFRFSR